MNLYYLYVLAVVYYPFHCGFACTVSRIVMSGCHFLHVIALIIFSFLKLLRLSERNMLGKRLLQSTKNAFY